MLDSKMLDEWLYHYNKLESESKELWNKMVESEAEGNDKRTSEIANHWHEVDARRKGMLDSLNIFGYTIVYHNSICTVEEY